MESLRYVVRASLNLNARVAKSSIYYYHDNIFLQNTKIVTVFEKASVGFREKVYKNNANFSNIECTLLQMIQWFLIIVKGPLNRQLTVYKFP